MSRTSRYALKERKNILIWRVGVYLRLSKEDLAEETDLSQSIVQQKKIIDRFIAENNDLRVIDYYIDDGFSGTSLNRPDFLRLQNDFSDKKINCIIIKDLSRLSRNENEAAKLIYVVFPFYKIRFISVNDRVDTFLDPDSIHRLDVRFKNIMNDEYARDISNKVISSRRIRAGKGEYVSAFTPYGYKKSESDIHKLVVDENVSNVVKDIFSQFISGYSVGQIAKKLTVSGEITPFYYKKAYGSNLYSPQKNETVWSPTTIKNILRNEVYTGDLIQCKFRVVSYKNHKVINNDINDWIIVRNNHEAIISKEDFEKARIILERKVIKKRRAPEYHCLSGTLKCGVCGRPMSITTKKEKEGYRAVICNSKYRGLSCCDGNRVSLSVIEETIIKSLNIFVKLYIDLDRLLNKNNFGNNEKSNTMLSEKLNSELSELKEKAIQLYVAFKNNIIAKDEYLRTKNHIDESIVIKEAQFKNLGKAKTNDLSENKRLSHFKYSKLKAGVKKLNKDIVNLFIKEVIIYDKSRIEIKFKFTDELTEMIKKNETVIIKSKYKKVLEELGLISKTQLLCLDKRIKT